ncbi:MULTISPECIES: acid-sensing system DNA-binding response regulator EvgA [Yersinia]|jgi:two-component system, NarL family, response regulator EvgA|uniref:Putative two-component response regulator n=1 Tax=Yersinia intermedia TaxID=631 RepID=A0A0T9N3B1_YERIN|nr:MULTISPECIES: acid-sensing system DNA-binding response regulator EvgA [Yersinia]AJJ19132.1 positive transcription regulator evgA [Yersinia intermedia]ARB86367.1 DNA-binding response regulator [Yersinia sp. FDAARGOS_228]AVL36222.1 DNA-binding response regulator [Yersinia intermedia]MCB5299721.1 acid-sensing system DNA-binding response regulator EvgA [Yersinia intermedia]MDA5513455.1 acid-sensing system DNA-binding response regulator EvgA [Yersinia intermedia]
MSAIIVDDHPLARLAILNLLENEGITVSSEAADGAEALKLIESTQPEIVILDVDIPILSGIEVVDTLRKQRYTGIIIVVSAKNDIFYGKRSVDAGANAFVSKKGGITNIISAIKAAQNGYSYFPFSLNGFVGSLSSEQEKLESLSVQEIKVMRYILNSADTASIAAEMNISSKTVSTYKSRLMEKLECKTLMDLFSFASRNGVG